MRRWWLEVTTAASSSRRRYFFFSMICSYCVCAVLFRVMYVAAQSLLQQVQEGVFSQAADRAAFSFQVRACCALVIRMKCGIVYGSILLSNHWVYFSLCQTVTIKIAEGVSAAMRRTSGAITEIILLAMAFYFTSASEQVELSVPWSYLFNAV